jgi:hypothetical protein
MRNEGLPIPGPGHVFGKPVCGIGGVLRATAEAPRDHGASPARYRRDPDSQTRIIILEPCPSLERKALCA